MLWAKKKKERNEERKKPIFMYGKIKVTFQTIFVSKLKNM